MNELLTQEQMELVNQWEDKYEQYQIVKAQFDNIDYQLKQNLLNYMKENGIKKIETEQRVITYVAPTKRKSPDTEQLKSMPMLDYMKMALDGVLDVYSVGATVYDATCKESEVKESIRIKER